MNALKVISGWVLAACVGLAGCTGETKRIGPDELSEIEIGTGLTSQDFRSVCQRMSRSLVQLPQIQKATTPPKVALAPMQNNSNAYIDENAFLAKMRKELIRNAEGRIVFLDRAIAATIDKETRDKDRGKLSTSGEQIRYGADFFLTGTIDSIDKVTVDGNTTYTRLSFRLTDAGTSAIVWEDDYEIKKHSKTGSVYK
ncbi:MAG: hypothetical protein NTU94_00135 [Planctomycetota bacterium]|nr:hypothetical protein [Planctomycetota bacterium]